MASDHRGEGEVAVSRERLTEIATELARRAQPEYVKARAHEVADDLKLKAKDAAREKVDDYKGRARMAVREKAHDVKEMAMQQGKGMNMWGALIGAGLGVAVVKLLQDRSRQNAEYRGFGPYAGYREVGYGFEGSFDRGYDYDGEGYADVGVRGDLQARGKFDEVKSQAGEKIGDLKAQASDKLDDLKSTASDTVESVKGRASDVVENVKGKASGMADRISSEAHQLREKVPSGDELRMKMNSAVDNDPVIVGLGALAFGAIAGLLLPVSDSERKAYSKVRIAAQEKLQEAGGMIQEKLQGVADQMDLAGDKMRGAADMVGSATSNSGTDLSASEEQDEETTISAPSTSASDPNLPSVH